MHFAVSIGELQRSFLAGFVEGEACLHIVEQNGGQSLACQMILNQRDDEQDMLEWLLASTGLGRLRRVPARLTSKPQTSWVVDSQDECRELLAIIASCGFHGRRAAELDLWRRAVAAWTQTSGEDRRSTLQALRADLGAARRFGRGHPTAAPFTSRRQFLGYISGFVSGEGCLGISRGRPRFSIHLRQDDRPLLELLAAETGLGKVTEHRPSAPLNPSATWTVAARAELADLRDLLWQGGLAGRKLRELDAWGRAVDEWNRAARVGVRPRSEILENAQEQLAAVRAYQPPQRAELLRLPGRDLRTESLDALRAWSRATAGTLACTDYMRWRRGRPDAPNRNTIVRQFGSWPAALEAAGLGARIARAPRRLGGEAARAAQRERRRALVVSAVRRFEREHGRWPRALEFFRWRLQAAVEAPSQATVYTRFPGGWAEVIEEARRTVKAAA
jgi:hypothetical protein